MHRQATICTMRWYTRRDDDDIRPGVALKSSTCDPDLRAGAAGPKFATICYKIRLNQSIDSIPDTSASAAAAAAKNAVTSVSLCSKKSFVFKLL